MPSQSAQGNEAKYVPGQSTEVMLLSPTGTDDVFEAFLQENANRMPVNARPMIQDVFIVIHFSELSY
jgi:hypothetical protein